MSVSNKPDSILSLGEHAARAIERAHESFKSAKITGGYGNALLMNYAKLKAITDRFEFMVCGIAGEIGYPCNLTARVVPTEVKPVIEPKAETKKVDHKAELAKLRAALGVPKPSVERPGGIVTSALQSELADIAAQVKSGASDWRLSTRLQELAQRVRNGVYEDSDLPF